MTMTMEDKEKCAALFEAFTGIETEPYRWNERAGDLLAEMISEIKRCTSGMGLARSMWPSTSKITWLWVVKIPYHIIRNQIKMKAGYVNTACYQKFVDDYDDLIEFELVR